MVNQLSKLLWFLECSSGAAESQRYANRWVVEVHGGPEAADALANKYGLETMDRYTSNQKPNHMHCLLHEE